MMVSEGTKEKVWCLIRPSLKAGKIETYRIMGTGFFISENKFITAYHALNDSAFGKHEKEYDNNYIILQNIAGDRMKITLQEDKIEYFPDKDLTSIIFDKKFIYLETETNVKEGEKVTNLGFPSKNAKNIIVIDTKNGLSIKKVEKQEGTIFKIKTNFLCEEKNQKSKVRIQKAIVTNYSTEKGFSGGPLLNEQGKVIGMVSRRYADALKSMVSISINEIAMLPHPFS